MTKEELMAENAMLRRKLSPLEDPEFTDELSLKMGPHDLTKFKRKFRKGEYIVLRPSDVADMCGMPHDKPVLTKIGRSLQAMCWERSALQGELVFVMTVKEYKDGVQ